MIAATGWLTGRSECVEASDGDVVSNTDVPVAGSARDVDSAVVGDWEAWGERRLP